MGEYGVTCTSTNDGITGELQISMKHGTLFTIPDISFRKYLELLEEYRKNNKSSKVVSIGIKFATRWDNVMAINFITK